MASRIAIGGPVSSRPQTNELLPWRTMTITRTLLLLQPGELVSLRFPACHHGLLRRSSLTQRHSRHLLLVRSGRGQVHRQRLGQVACSHLAGFQSTGDNIGHITWASLIDAIMGHLNLLFLFFIFTAHSFYLCTLTVLFITALATRMMFIGFSWS